MASLKEEQKRARAAERAEKESLPKKARHPTVPKAVEVCVAFREQVHNFTMGPTDAADVLYKETARTFFPGEGVRFNLVAKKMIKSTVPFLFYDSAPTMYVVEVIEGDLAGNAQWTCPAKLPAPAASPTENAAPSSPPEAPAAMPAAAAPEATPAAPRSQPVPPSSLSSSTTTTNSEDEGAAAANPPGAP